MNQKIAEYVTNRFVENGIIEEKDKAVYQYGVSQGVVILINLITTVLIGMVFGMVEQSIIFILAFIPIRIYAGGYHAESQIRCYVLSSLLIAAAMINCKLVSWNTVIGFTEAGIGTLLLLLFSPVADKKKPISMEEKISYKKISSGFLIAELFIAGIFFRFTQMKGFQSIVTALFFLGIILIAGKIKNSSRDKQFNI